MIPFARGAQTKTPETGVSGASSRCLSSAIRCLCPPAVSSGVGLRLASAAASFGGASGSCSGSRRLFILRRYRRPAFRFASAAVSFGGAGDLLPTCCSSSVDKTLGAVGLCVQLQNVEFMWIALRVARGRQTQIPFGNDKQRELHSNEDSSSSRSRRGRRRDDGRRRSIRRARCFRARGLLRGI